MTEMAWMAGERTAKTYIEGLLHVLRLVAWVDRQVSKLPLAGGIKDRAEVALLDTLFGPAEDCDYVSTTAPASPPPAL